MLLPIVTQVVGIVTQAVTWFGNLDRPSRRSLSPWLRWRRRAAGNGAGGGGRGNRRAGVIIGIVVAAIAALAAAWVSDFGGIRTTVTAFWEQNLETDL